MTEPLNVLFLCDGNSARSILAEAIMNREGAGRIRGYSAGSRPIGAPDPLAIALLQREGFDTGFARSKSWHEFANPAAPEMDFVFTICNAPAAVECAYWPGLPVSAQWGLIDPATVAGSEAEKAMAFAETYRTLTRRIKAFASLALTTLDGLPLRAKPRDVGMIGADLTNRKLVVDTAQAGAAKLLPACALGKTNGWAKSLSYAI